MKPEDIQLRSEAVRDILGNPPAWLVRWGTFVVFLIITSLITLTFFIEYPDKVVGKVILTSDIPPTKVIARVSGNLSELNVEDGNLVETGKIIGAIESSTEKESLDILEEKLNTFLYNDSLSEFVNFPNNLKLGSLQGEYANFLQRLEEYKIIEKSSMASTAIASISNQVVSINNVINLLNKQLNDCNANLNRMFSDLNKDYQLLQKGFLSEREYSNKQNSVSAQQAECNALERQIAENKVRISNLKLESSKQGDSNYELEIEKYSRVREAANALLGSIAQWKENYLIIAPVSGKVVLNNIWSTNQFIEAGSEILSIITDTGNIKAKAFLPSENIGKVDTGQRVQLKFAGYNYREFGVVKGFVGNIADVPRENLYQADIILDNELTTSFGKDIAFKHNMEGVAEVITKKRTIAERVFDNFRYLVEDRLPK